MPASFLACEHLQIFAPSRPPSADTKPLDPMGSCAYAFYATKSATAVMMDGKKLFWSNAR